jgi:Ca2+-binding RTX toxin-like protein
MNLRTQLEGNSFAELMMRNTNVNTLKADAFATADCKFQMGMLAGTPQGFTDFGNTVADDPSSECDESLVLIRRPDGRIDYRQFNAVDPSGINAQAVYNGTTGVDRIRGGNDNDTFWGGPGNDVIEGGSGADVALGGVGDDIITDLAGDDVPKGGPGDDAIDAGPGLDIVMSGEGKDFSNGGANANETFGGDGDDFIYLGQSLDAAFGDSGDDWEEGGDQPDLMQGESGNLFFLDDSQVPGHDVLVGQGGDDDYDMEGGDDIGVGGSGIEKVAGASGFDWEIGQGEPQAQDMDLALPIPPLDILQVGVRDKFNEVEALSGWNLDDTLRGDDLVPTAVGGAGFIGCDVLDQAGLDRIDGLDALVPPLNTPLATVIGQSASRDCPILSGPNVWGDGNILLGGGGSDLIEGRGADDIIDGDAYVSVRLSVRTDPGNPATEIGSAEITGPGQSAMTSQYLRTTAGALTGPTLQQAVFAGTVNPRNIVAVREIKQGTGGIDTALFSGPQTEYTITPVTNGVRVAHVGGTATDGVDTVTRVENLRFCEVRDPNTDACTQFSNLALAVPAQPVITSVTALNGSALVRFSEPAGSTVTGFTVQAFRSGSLFTSVNAASVDTSATVTGLANGTPYTFKVVAHGTGGDAASAESAPVTPQPPAPTAPGAPTIGTATGGVGGASVTWTAPASDGGAAIQSYKVEVLNSASAVVATQTVTAPATSSAVGLPAGSYRFRVSATNSVGTGLPSGLSNTVTVTADTTAPVISARSPLAGAINVAVGSVVTATFSEPVQNVTNTTFTLRIGAGAPIAATVTMNAAKTAATLTPTAPLNNLTTYTATLTGGAAGIRDLAGNPLTTSSWNFRTVADVIAPTVTSRTPGPGATGVAVGSNVVVVFSERVTVPNNAFTLTNLANGRRINAAVSVSADGRTATLNPNANLAAGRTFRVNLTNAIRDAAGNRLTAVAWTFTT